MKKIVGIIAAAAMATSVFAVDVASMIKITGDLFNYDGDNFRALKADQYAPSDTSNYLWKLSATSEKAGAEIWSYAIDGSVTEKKLWFKPIDLLKISVGDIGSESISSPKFGWYATNFSLYDYGYQLDFELDAITATLAIAPGAGSYWIDGSADGIDKLGAFWLDFGYDLGDFGKVQGIVARKAALGIAHNFDGFDTDPTAAWAFGAAYSNIPEEGLGYYADVVASLDKKFDETKGMREGNIGFQGIDSQLGVQFVSGGMGLYLNNVVQYRNADYAWLDTSSSNIPATGYKEIKDGDDVKGTIKYGFEVKAAYAIDAYTPYLQIIGYNIFDKEMTVDLGVTTNVGGCDIDVKVELPIAFENYNFTFSVPVEFKLTL